MAGNRLLSARPLILQADPRKAGAAVRSKCRLAEVPAPRALLTPATRATHPAGRQTEPAEIRGLSRTESRAALPVGPFAESSPPGPAIDFEHAYHLYKRRVYAKCLHMIGNEADAEDLTQEVFLQVFRKLHSFRGESAFATWLYRVAVNVVLVRLRRKTLNLASFEEVLELKEGMATLQEVLGAPDQMLTSAIDRLNLQDALSQMPAGYKQVFFMHDVEGYRHREIARILGLSEGTSKSQLYKARVRLRQLLGERDAQPLPNRVVGTPRRLSQGAGRSSSRRSDFPAHAPCPAGRENPAHFTGVPDRSFRE